MTPIGAVGLVEYASEEDYLKAPLLLEGVPLEGQALTLTRFSGMVCKHFTNG
jgi:hypothetical protein